MKQDLQPSDKRLTKLTLDQDAIDALAQLTTERRRGEFVSSLIREAYQRQAGLAPSAPPAHAAIAAQMRNLADQLEM